MTDKETKFKRKCATLQEFTEMYGNREDGVTDDFISAEMPSLSF